MEEERRSTSRGAFRSQVQANMRQTVGSVVGTSSVVLGCSLGFRLCKIGLVEYLLVNSDEDCTKLGSWVTGMLVLDCLYLFLTMGRLVKAMQARGGVVERSRLEEVCERWLDRGYLYGHIIGNYFYYCTPECNPASPSVTDLTFWLLVLGYTYYSFPCWFFCVICLCLPVLVIILLRWKDYNKSEASLKQINALIEVRSLPFGGEDCPICSVGLLPEEKLARLPCDERHVFHRDCLISWLKINPSCPICRYHSP